jgi:glycosyltransferase involved in cell wall biosynthesis
MVPDEFGVSPVGKVPLGININVYGTGSYFTNDVMQWNTWALYAITGLWMNELGYYPIMQRVPTRDALVGDEYPGASVLRRVYTQQFDSLTTFARHEDDDTGKEELVRRAFPMLHVADSLSEANELWGSQNVALCYERPLVDDETWVAALRRFDLVLVGSAWAKAQLDKLDDAPAVAVLPPFLSASAFAPRAAGEAPFVWEQRTDRAEGKFVIFSSGEFEGDSGSDIVLAAFRKFSKLHDHVVLYASWYPPAPKRKGAGRGIASVAEAGLVKSVPRSVVAMESVLGRVVQQEVHWAHWLAAEDVDPMAVITDDPNMQNDTYFAEVVANADVALFPNRVAPSANLHLLKAMAAGTPVIASSGTGHDDVCTAAACLLVDVNGAASAADAVDAVVAHLGAVKAGGDPSAAAARKEAALRVARRFSVHAWTQGLAAALKKGRIVRGDARYDASALVKPAAWRAEAAVSEGPPLPALAAFGFLAFCTLVFVVSRVTARRKRAHFRVLLTDVYNKCAPEKLGNVEAVLAAYAGHEEAMMVKVRETYKLKSM